MTEPHSIHPDLSPAAFRYGYDPGWANRVELPIRCGEIAEHRGGFDEIISVIRYVPITKNLRDFLLV
jgi:hypothetical protein